MAEYTNYPNGVAVGPPGAPTVALDPNSGLVLGAGGSAITNLIVNQLTLTPAAVAANTTAEQTFAATGVAAGDVVLSVNKPTAQVGLGIVGMRVSTAGTIGITFSNNTSGSITPTAGEIYDVVTVTPG